MKTSNKIIISTVVLLFLSIITYTFMMRGAYQEALKNPRSNRLRIDLKAIKYLNINHSSYVAFKYGKKYEIELNKGDKDSLQIDYQGDIANLKIANIENVIIYLPQLPVMSFTKNDKSRNETEGIFVDGSFQSGEFVVTSLKNTNIEFGKCYFDKIDIQSKNKAEISMENCEVKLFNLSLPKYSTLNVNYSNILSKNIALGDSCSIVIVGNQSTFLK